MYKTIKNKSKNKDLILECIFRNAPISRTEIAELTGITPAATTLTVAELIEEQAVFEIGQNDNDTTSVGRKRISLDLCPGYRFSMGIEFNQKAFMLCITDFKGSIIYKYYEKYSSEISNNITTFLINAINTALEQSKVPVEKLVGIGVAVPGHMDKSGRHLVSNNNIWTDLDAETVKQSFQIPVVFENNVRCMALSQYLFHPEYTPDSFTYFHVGMGMFCANIIEGRLLLGNAYVSGEIGHTIVKPDGLRCECGKQGCLQTIASERWLLQTARKLYDAVPSSVLHQLVTCPEEITIKTLATAYSIGDETIQSLIANALKYLGLSTSNIAILMNPERIFLHGELFNFPDIHDELIRTVDNQLQFLKNDCVNGIDILPYHPEDGAIGGAALAILECFLQISYSV